MQFEIVNQGTKNEFKQARPTGIGNYPNECLYAKHPEGWVVVVPIEKRDDVLRRLADAWIKDGPNSFFGVYGDPLCTIVVDTLGVY
jgi:hypothetical protein